MTLEILDWIPGSFEETDKYIEVVDGHFFKAKQTGEVQINVFDNTGKPSVALV